MKETRNYADYPESAENLKNSENPENPENSENPENLKNPENPENPENAIVPVDVDGIMQEIRAEIRQKGFTEAMLDFEEIPLTQTAVPETPAFSLSRLKQSAEYLQVRSQIEPYKAIEGNFLVKCVKKMLRKLMKFYILPIMTEQNALNLHTASAVNQLYAHVSEQAASGADQATVAELVSRMQKLELQQSVSQQELQALRSQVRKLTAENAQLREKVS